ncbi:multiple inositol polyphosphate phosphatase 1-like [Adelges cooleyi]|uniref:multiple inositol polyphosphate phosphatase 1-like n=1 Tax=Adelges cooleyi TaxID=133065 RepID=UPI0021808BBE|nr:multiple inositol polyphosphate phosphatase 1-like [Adelges cooleyi]
MLKFLCILTFFLVTVKAIPYGFFSTKTSYELVSAPKIEVPEGLTPRQIFMLGRHGTRGPTINFNLNAIPKILKYQNKFTERATLEPEDMEAIKNWETVIDTTGDKSITQKGHDEIKYLAIRIREAFPNLFERKYNSEYYEVLTVPDPRCDLSGQTLLQNLFNDDTITSIPVCGPKDSLLMIEELKRGNEKMKTYYLNQMKEFREGEHMNGVVQRVADRMGIDFKDINYEIVNVMYEVATFELAIDDSKVSPWYKLFGPDDLEIFEYALEIFRYYFHGYGDPFNAKLACPMAIRLEESFKNKINGEGPDGHFYFGHSTNVLSFYIMLGLAAGDDALTASNYHGMADLKWRTSLFSPWAANVMVVLYEDTDDVDYKVAFYFNEHITSIPLGNDRSCTVCLWSDIQKKLQAFISENNCVNFLAEYKSKTA